MGRYDTYFRGPMVIGTGTDNITAPDGGSVLLSQQQNNAAFASAADTYFQLPLNSRLKDVIIDFGGSTNPSAGSLTVAAGTAATTLGTPLILVSSVAINTNTARTVSGFANPTIAAWNLITNLGTNTFLRVSLTGVTPVGVTAISVLVSYIILPTNP